MSNNLQSEQDETVKEISKYLMMWVGIVVCVLSVVSFFLSTETLVRLLLETELEHVGDDSDASSLIYNIEIKLLELGIWLKGLPLAAKISGTVLGGLLWFSNAD
jgi:hypothetical protein